MPLHTQSSLRNFNGYTLVNDALPSHATRVQCPVSISSPPVSYLTRPLECFQSPISRYTGEGEGAGYSDHGIFLSQRRYLPYISRIYLLQIKCLPYLSQWATRLHGQLPRTAVLSARSSKKCSRQPFHSLDFTDNTNEIWKDVDIGETRYISITLVLMSGLLDALHGEVTESLYNE